MTDLTNLLTTRRIIVCLGSGGVGKTTLSASLGLWGALNGRRTAIVTIDPAQRLADCLGLHDFSAPSVTLSHDAFLSQNLNPSASLTIFRVNQQHAWDALVDQYVPTPEGRFRIRTNRFYQGLSQTFAGSHDYIALDQLAQLIATNTYDLIVVDTPPAKHAVDFLRTPHQLQRLLQHSFSQRFLHPAVKRGWETFSSANQLGTALLARLEHATGLSTLGDIAAFFSITAHMIEDLSIRLTQVSGILTSEETAFLLVATLNTAPIAETQGFFADLNALGVVPQAVVVNRVTSTRGTITESARATPIGGALCRSRVERSCKTLRGARLNKQQLKWLVENFVGYQKRICAEIQHLEALQAQFHSPIPLLTIPFCPSGPMDLGSLARLHQYLF